MYQTVIYVWYFKALKQDESKFFSLTIKHLVELKRNTCDRPLLLSVCSECGPLPASESGSNCTELHLEQWFYARFYL